MTVTIHIPTNTKPLTESLSEAFAEAIFHLYNTEFKETNKKEEGKDAHSDLQP